MFQRSNGREFTVRERERERERKREREREKFIDNQQGKIFQTGFLDRSDTGEITLET
jgi:hypothetical protein